MCQWINMCDYEVGYYAGTVSKTHAKTGQRIMPRWRPFCRRYRMFCFTSSQLYHFATNFDRVLLQLVGTDIEYSLFKYRV